MVHYDVFKCIVLQYGKALADETGKSVLAW